jgi:hypothetical protein
MLQIDIKPHLGIDVKNIGEVKLGQSQKEIESFIGLPNISETIAVDNTQTNRAFYDAYELRIDYNSDNEVTFIEFIYGPFPEKTELRIYGVDPFKESAERLIELLTIYNAGKIDESEAPHSYAFEKISVGIWRQSVPSDIQELIEEKKGDNTYEIDKAWVNEELEKSKHFWTIGIGRKGYYNS